jgi:hypothetical protein
MFEQYQTPTLQRLAGMRHPLPLPQQGQRLLLVVRQVKRLLLAQAMSAWLLLLAGA